VHAGIPGSTVNLDERCPDTTTTKRA